MGEQRVMDGQGTDLIKYLTFDLHAKNCLSLPLPCHLPQAALRCISLKLLCQLLPDRLIHRCKHCNFPGSNSAKGWDMLKTNSIPDHCHMALTM